MPHSKSDLFTVDPKDPPRDWGTLVREFEKQDPSLLSIWREQYEKWKAEYTRFRAKEEETFFSAGEGQEPRRLDEGTLGFHRRGIIALLSSGEKCEANLVRLPLDDNEGQERSVCLRRIRVLLDSLRESLDLWHPVNAERVIELRKLAPQ